MALHKRKKIEIIINAPYLERVSETLDAAGATGYTVLRSLGGRGTHGVWQEDRLSRADETLVLIAIVNSETAEKILAALERLFETHNGIAYAQDVEVMRPERF